MAARVSRLIRGRVATVIPDICREKKMGMSIKMKYMTDMSIAMKE